METVQLFHGAEIQLQGVWSVLFVASVFICVQNCDDLFIKSLTLVVQ